MSFIQEQGQLSSAPKVINYNGGVVRISGDDNGGIFKSYNEIKFFYQTSPDLVHIDFCINF